eukprot:7090174-Prorocentrum_lima.AAC.1
MTSSLVGSEMCIRDSFKRRRRLSMSWSRLWWRTWVKRSGNHRPELWPVSYTHLTLPTICSV